MLKRLAIDIRTFIRHLREHIFPISSINVYINNSLLEERTHLLTITMQEIQTNAKNAAMFSGYIAHIYVYFSFE